jgi:hypothetical protein
MELAVFAKLGRPFGIFVLVGPRLPVVVSWPLGLAEVIS